MKQIFAISTGILLLGFSLTACAGTGEEQPDSTRMKKKRNHVPVVAAEAEYVRAFEVNMEEFEERMEEWEETDMREFERRMERMAEQLADIPMDELEEQLKDIEVRMEGRRFFVDMPVIAPLVFEMPPMPPMPDLEGLEAALAPLAELRFVQPGSRGELRRLFPSISESEELQVQALRSLARRGSENALPQLLKAIRESKSAAVRYQAVQLVQNYSKDESIVPLLGEIARNDSDVNVRKKAVAVLGRSGDARAIRILEDLIKQAGE